MKLKKSIRTRKGTIIPAGTNLSIGVEGFCHFKGETIFKKYIPDAAIESDSVADTEQVNNSYNSESKWKEFDDIKSGDRGFDVHGKPITILGKGVGQSGCKELEDEFGNASDMSFDDLVNGFTDEEIKDLQFIAYSTDEDGLVFVSLYGQDFAGAVESDESVAIPFNEVEPGDTGINSEGKAFKVYATGTGRTWFENVKEAQELEVEFPEIPEGIDEEQVDFVYGAYENGPKSIELYGQAGIRVMPIDDNEE